MTLPSPPLSLINIKNETGDPLPIELSWVYANTRSDQRPSPNALRSYGGMAWYQKNTDGNCSNGNCTNNCNCGNIQCVNCFISGSVNCANCDTRNWLQANCNCACTYNCNFSTTASYNCDCDCAPPDCG
jgi:hypothetical protein